MALKRGHGTWQYKDAFRPVDAARELAWYGPEQSGNWQPVTRTFRNGRTTTWWAADARLGWRGPDGVIRLMVATTDPATRREPQRRGRSHPERVRGSASTPSRARVSGAASGVRAIGPLLPDSDDADIAWSAHV